MFSTIRGHLKHIKGGVGCCHIDLQHRWCYVLQKWLEHEEVSLLQWRHPGFTPIRLGVKVRKVHGGYLYQPPNLKTISYLVLDKYRSKAGLPRSRLYEGVQKCLDQLIDRVEDKLMGLDPTGTLLC